MITVRTYEKNDWAAVERIHDSARKTELALAGLKDAFVPLRVAAHREGLFEYPGLFVAEQDGEVVGFCACSQDELAWLYVDPMKVRQGIGRSLSLFALEQFPAIRHIEALKGNEPARILYESLGFEVVGIEQGALPGNEAFTVSVYCMERR